MDMAVSRKRNAFKFEQQLLSVEASAVTRETSVASNHAVARNISAAAGPHDIADGARRARTARHGGDITVGRHAARRTPPRVEAPIQIGGRGFCTGLGVTEVSGIL